VHAVADVDVEVRTGELLVVRGRSGAGKNDAAEPVGRAGPADVGLGVARGAELTAMTEDEALAVRRHELAFISSRSG
jgi:putative ABC transport system ATP-binding protein